MRNKSHSRYLTLLLEFIYLTIIVLLIENLYTSCLKTIPIIILKYVAMTLTIFSIVHLRTYFRGWIVFSSVLLTYSLFILPLETLPIMVFVFIMLLVETLLSRFTKYGGVERYEKMSNVNVVTLLTRIPLLVYLIGRVTYGLCYQ